MALQLSVSARNAAIDAVETAVGTAPKLRIYNGTLPSSCAAAANGTMLVEITLPSDWLTNASNGQKTNSATWSGTASASGTATYFRILDSSGSTCHMQGTVGTSGADLVLDNTSINSGQTVQITSFTLSALNS